jgi:clan AA aspartic protease (TIGR02281 family)
MSDLIPEPVLSDPLSSPREFEPQPRRSQWDSGSDRSHVKTFVLAAALMALIGVGALAAQPGAKAWWRKKFGPPATTEELRAQVAECEQAHDLACAQDAWTDYLKLRPDDGLAHANLGQVMNRRDDHAHAVVEFKRAIDGGEGAYDLFGWYADSLASLGRNDEAIDWSYKSLSIVPNLVDVRGKLAKLLVAQGRPYEALSLLQGFDAESIARGHPAYFEGQRIAIASGLTDAAAAPSPHAKDVQVLRLPVMGGHFFAPVALGGGRPQAFMVDTGATVTAVTPEMLEQSKAAYKVVQPVVIMTTADGRKVTAQGITIVSLAVGPYMLHDVTAVLCTHCVSLLGQSALSHFDLRSSRTQGVEFLTLTARGNV